MFNALTAKVYHTAGKCLIYAQFLKTKEKKAKIPDLTPEVDR